MRRLGVIVGIVAALAIGAGAYLYLSGAEYVVEVPEQDIDAAVQQRFPIQERKAGVLKTSLTNPQLKLDGGSERLYLDLEVEVDLGLAGLGLGRSESGAATISSGLSYDREKGRLMLDGTRIEELHVEELPEKYRGPAREVINEALTRYVDGLVVYQLSSDSYQDSLARLFLKDVQVGDGVVRASLGLGA